MVLSKDICMCSYSIAWVSLLLSTLSSHCHGTCIFLLVAVRLAIPLPVDIADQIPVFPARFFYHLPSHNLPVA
uniref:Putative secreted peptide n=1 Tax=Anopheles braziliensis TaxID=58242 RepID=A0A2M3ZXE0_9DIPT